MKKVLIVLSLLLSVSCTGHYYSVDKESKVSGATHFEYSNHEYIKFYGSEAATTCRPGMSIVHNPDCKYCKK